MSTKKIILERGKWLTNGTKILSTIIAVATNVIYFIFKKQVLPYEKQQSLLLLCGFIVLIFLPIDFSLIIKNIISKKLEE
jgi:hypothetical protein